MRGTCGSGGGSVHLTFCTSLSAASPVNVPGGLAASPLATPAPGKENRRFAVPSAYSFRLSGRARSYIHVGRALSARPCASPRPYGNASAIFSRTRSSLGVLRQIFAAVMAACSIGSERVKMPSRRVPAPCPALRKRLGDFQPDQAIAVSIEANFYTVIAVCVEANLCHCHGCTLDRFPLP